MDLNKLLKTGGGALRNLLDAERDEMIGRSFSGFRIESLLGEGGMSVVYLAGRTDGEFEQSVVFKFLRNFGADGRSRDRLLLERQILADLSHANVARLLDGGVTEDGLPYLVMEYVDGPHIDEFCADHALDVRQRVLLFEQVVRALEHAHSHAVIHRDIKPSNILVSKEGVVKLLDFGIAKILDSGSADTQQIMTLSYCSPEQIENQSLSVATDIYQLGIVLYELIADRNPFSGVNESQAHIVEAITRSTPVRPSDALLGQGQKTAARVVRGDLDAIVLKCLQRDPEKRYSSCRELLNDLKAFRRGQAVGAREGGLGYGLWRLFRRNPLASAIAASALLVLVLVIALSFARIDAARNEALARAQTAERVQNLTREIVKTASPYSSSDHETTRELLVVWEDEVRTTLDREPAIQAELLHLIGATRLQLGLPQEARAPLLDALQLLDERNEPSGEVLVSLAEMAFNLDQVDAALQYLERGADRVDGVTLARWYSVRGDVLIGTQSIAQALESFEQAALIYARLGPAYQDQWVSSRINWAEALVVAEQPKKALQIMDSVMGGGSRPTGLSGLAMADALQAYGQVLGINSRWTPALAAFTEALELRQSRLDAGHPDIAQAIGAQAQSNRYLGNREVALSQFQTAMELFSAGPQRASRPALSNRFNYANLLSDSGHIPESLTVFQGLLELMERRDPPAANTCKVLNNIGGAYMEMGMPDRAAQTLTEAMSCKLKVFGPDAQTTGNTQMSLADALLMMGETQPAIELIAAGERIRTNQFGIDSPRMAYPLDLRGEWQSQTGRHDQALATLQRSVRLRQENGERGSLHFSQTVNRLAHAHSRHGDVDAAITAYDEAADLVIAGSEPEHPVALGIRVDRLMAYLDLEMNPPESAGSLFDLINRQTPYRTDLLNQLYPLVDR